MSGGSMLQWQESPRGAPILLRRTLRLAPRVDDAPGFPVRRGLALASSSPAVAAAALHLLRGARGLRLPATGGADHHHDRTEGTEECLRPRGTVCRQPRLDPG